MPTNETPTKRPEADHPISIPIAIASWLSVIVLIWLLIVGVIEANPVSISGFFMFLIMGLIASLMSISTTKRG